MISRQNNLYRA